MFDHRSHLPELRRMLLLRSPVELPLAEPSCIDESNSQGLPILEGCGLQQRLRLNATFVELLRLASVTRSATHRTAGASSGRESSAPMTPGVAACRTGPIDSQVAMRGRKMEDELQVPDPFLMESMRSVGYSLEAALADLVDNSLSAEAKNIEIYFRSTGEEPLIAVMDDGRGMDPLEARTALRLAGTNTSQKRGASDLGRFGLGLKTASLSQARVLTVVTKKAGVTTGLQWDLDYLLAKGTWSLRVLDQQEISLVPVADSLRARESGTLVVWGKLDLLLGDAQNTSTYMAERMAEAAEHLELVFHRFLGGDASHKPVAIAINDRPLQVIDPFLEKNPATQRSPLEMLGPSGSQIAVQTFTLPHLSKLSEADRTRGRIGARMRDSQGFYVYRNRRLIDWGSWFRLTPKDELAKLARVRVDIPNSLDGLWGLDIKKSRAVPPDSVRRELRRLIERIVGQSKKVHQYRGRADESQADGIFVWQLVKGRNSFEYRINREHPLLAVDWDHPMSSARLESIFSLVEQMFPVNDVYARMSSDLQPDAPDFSDEFLVAAATGMWAKMREGLGGDFERFTDVLSSIEPFNSRSSSPEWFAQRRNEIENG